MSQTLINGTAYEIDHGNTLISGTNYTIEKGNTLISGIAYEIILKEEDSMNYEDYYLHLIPQSSSMYISSSTGSISFTNLSNDLTNYFDQIDNITWESNSGSWFIYRKMGQDDISEFLPLVEYSGSSGDSWFSSSSGSSVTDQYALKRSEVVAGTGIKVYYKSGGTWTSMSPSFSGGHKILIQWHENSNA